MKIQEMFMMIGFPILLIFVSWSMFLSFEKNKLETIKGEQEYKLLVEKSEIYKELNRLKDNMSKNYFPKRSLPYDVRKTLKLASESCYLEVAYFHKYEECVSNYFLKNYK